MVIKGTILTCFLKIVNIYCGIGNYIITITVVIKDYSYYCEPKHSEQKGELEKNHEYIRYIIPKGTSFDGLIVIPPDDICLRP